MDGTEPGERHGLGGGRAASGGGVRGLCFAVGMSDVIERLLAAPGRWAVVGLSTNTARPAYGVSAYVQGLGHEIVPVHPRAETVHGAPGVATLAEIEGPVDVVDVFVNSSIAGSIMDQAIEIGAKAVWLQLGVHDAAAEQRVRDAGLDLVMDTCPKIEGPRLGLT